MMLAVPTVSFAICVLSLAGMKITENRGNPFQKCFMAFSGILALVFFALSATDSEHTGSLFCVLSAVATVFLIADATEGKTGILSVVPLVSAVTALAITATGKDYWIVYSVFVCVPLAVLFLSDIAKLAKCGFGERLGTAVGAVIAATAAVLFAVPAAYGPNPPLTLAGFAVFSLLMYLESEITRITMGPNGLLINRYRLENILGRKFPVYRDNPDLNMCIAFGDMDSFGRIRREQGRDVAEECIFEVMNALAQLRSGKFLPCIYGGDEFVFVFFGDKAFAEECIDRCYSAIAEIDKRYPFLIHMSIGLAEVTDQDNYDDVIFQADRILSEVKEKFYRDNGLQRHVWGRK